MTYYILVTRFWLANVCTAWSLNKNGKLSPLCFLVAWENFHGFGQLVELSRVENTFWLTMWNMWNYSPYWLVASSHNCDGWTDGRREGSSILMFQRVIAFCILSLGKKTSMTWRQLTFNKLNLTRVLKKLRQALKTCNRKQNRLLFYI